MYTDYCSAASTTSTTPIITANASPLHTVKFALLQYSNYGKSTTPSQPFVLHLNFPNWSSSITSCNTPIWQFTAWHVDFSTIHMPGQLWPALQKYREGHNNLLFSSLGGLYCLELRSNTVKKRQCAPGPIRDFAHGNSPTCALAGSK